MEGGAVGHWHVAAATAAIAAATSRARLAHPTAQLVRQMLTPFFPYYTTCLCQPHCHLTQRTVYTHDDADMTGNAPLSKNVGRLSRAQVNARRAKVPRKGEKKVAEEKATTTKKTVGGAKNGGERTVPANKAVRYYQAESQTRQKIARKSNTTAKLRSSITPGTVLILLAGRFRGKRVVFLKQLASGLLLVSGPFKVNGVPLRRVNQAYVIATSTKIDVSSVEVRSISTLLLHAAACADADSVLPASPHSHTGRSRRS